MMVDTLPEMPIVLRGVTGHGFVARLHTYPHKSTHSRSVGTLVFMLAYSVIEACLL